MYALGQLGWSLALFGVANLLTYYYMPPETGTVPLFPNYIYQGAIWGFATVIGIISFGGRIFDAITDPIIAAMSDRSVSKFGRRRLFMAIAFIPLAILSYLVFHPITAEPSTLNTVWLCITIVLFYFFLTLYVTPYTALISELGHSSNERLTISTLLSVTFMLGYIIGTQVYALQDYFAQFMPPDEAFRMVIQGFALVSGVLMALPIVFVNEAKYCVQYGSQQGTMTALRAVFSNRNFTVFVLADLMYWLSLTFIQMGVVYYITVLLQQPASYGSLLLTVMMGLSFLFYYPINVFVKKRGKKIGVTMAFVGFCMVFTLVYFSNVLPWSPTIIMVLIGLMGSVPLAILSILPNAIVADIADLDGRETGHYKAGMFFAARAFTTKFGIAAANFLFPSLLLLGKSVDNNFGVRMTALMAIVFCTIGLVVFLRYEEVVIDA